MRKKKWRSTTTIAAFTIAVVLTGLYYWLQPPSAPSAVIFTGGPIITMEAGQPTIEAVLVEQGRITAVGTLAKVKVAAKGQPAVIDLDGNTLMPGLIEPHTHPLAAAMLSAAVDVSGFRHNNRPEVISSLKAGIAEGGNGGWIVAFGWDPVMLDDLTAPTLEELDTLSPDLPLVILTQMMHDAYANSLALAAAGITPETVNPEGGEYVKNSAGKLTGTIREISAINTLFSALPPPPAGAYSLLLDQQYKKYARAGYTTLGILGPLGRSKDPISILKKTAKQKSVPVRTLIYALPEQIDREASPEQHLGTAPIIGVKYWMDGSPFAGGAAFAEPYENSELVKNRLHLKDGHIGALNYENSVFKNNFTNYHQRGFQVATHVQGELAIDRVLDVIEAVLQKHPRPDHRHRLEHNALITKNQLARAAQLGVTTSFFIDHLYFYGHALPDLVGERTKRYMPIKSALEAGHKATVHTDNPATPVNAFRAMQTLRMRTSRLTGETIAPEQRLTPHEALATMTINAAWQLGLENETGSIKVGKSADFLIVSKNPLETADLELQNIQIISTWLKGQPVDTRTITPTAISLGFDILSKMIFTQ